MVDPQPKKSSITATPHMRPIIGIMRIRAGDGARIATTFLALSKKSLAQSLHLCLLADEADSANLSMAGRYEGSHCRLSVSQHPCADINRTLSAITSTYPGHDLVFLGAGVELPFAWDYRLAIALESASHLAAAVPLCDVAPMFALVDPTLPPPASITADDIDRSAYCMGLRNIYEVPAVHGTCVLLRGETVALAANHLAGHVANLTEWLDTFIIFIRTHGLSAVLCDYLYVGSGGTTPEPLIKPTLETDAFLRQHPLAALRRAVNESLQEAHTPLTRPGLDGKPVQLHIVHYWGGGTDKWVHDFGRADQVRNNLVFSTYRIGERGGQRLVLFSDPVSTTPIRTWDIAQPIQSTLVGCLDYRRILSQIVLEYSVDTILVSSLIGHTLDALTLPVKTAVICHDYYPICQAINPQFDTTCTRCTLDDLKRCKKSNPLNRIFTDQSSEAWHALRTQYVDRLTEHNITLIAPSPSVIRTLISLDARIATLPTYVIPHGIDFIVTPLPTPTLQSGERLRIVVVGRLSIHKGLEFLRDCHDVLNATADVSLLGCGAEGMKLAAACGWTAIERYHIDELAQRLAEMRPHLALLPSIVPETFSYALSELRSLAIPVAATNLGSFTDRIIDGESGFLFEPSVDGLNALLTRLSADPSALGQVARNCRDAEPKRTAQTMVEAYHTVIPMSNHVQPRLVVGVGLQTALTEPYRHLSEAYGHLESAYQQTSAAYVQTRGAYEEAQRILVETHADHNRDREQLMRWRTLFDVWANKFDQLHLSRKWWNLLRLISDARALRQSGRTLHESVETDENRTGSPH